MGVSVPDGLDALLARPVPRERAYVFPSGAARLLGCPLRVAYETSGPGRSAATPAVRLGTAAHAVLEVAAKLKLGVPDEGWKERADAAWASAIAVQVAESRARPEEADWPPPERWPYYARRKITTRRLAEKIAKELATSPAVVVTEEEQEGLGGRLRGRADLIIRRPDGSEIRDYKTSSVVEGEPPEPLPAYRLQLQLYAALEEAQTGNLPVRARLVPLEGDPVDVDVARADVDATVTAVADALNAYNDSVRGGADFVPLGNPSTQNCRFCPHTRHCPAFWGTADVGWEDQGVRAVAGVVEAQTTSARGISSLSLTVLAGTSGAETVHVDGLEAQQQPALPRVSVGSTVGLTSLRRRLPDGRYQAGAYSQLVVAPT